MSRSRSISPAHPNSRIPTMNAKMDEEQEPANLTASSEPTTRRTTDLSSGSSTATSKASIRRTLDENDRREALKFLSRLRRGLSHHRGLDEIVRLKAKLNICLCDDTGADGSDSVFLEPGEVASVDEAVNAVSNWLLLHSKSTLV